MDHEYSFDPPVYWEDVHNPDYYFDDITKITFSADLKVATLYNHIGKITSERLPANRSDLLALCASKGKEVPYNDPRKKMIDEALF